VVPLPTAPVRHLSRGGVEGHALSVALSGRTSSPTMVRVHGVALVSTVPKAKAAGIKPGPRVQSLAGARVAGDALPSLGNGGRRAGVVLDHAGDDARNQCGTNAISHTALIAHAAKNTSIQSIAQPR
jgi:hypothetical protein